MSIFCQCRPVCSGTQFKILSVDKSAMSTAAVKKIAQHKLSLQELLDQLLAEGLVNQEVQQKILKAGRMSKLHPLVTIHRCQMIMGTNGRPWEMEDYTQWLARYAKMPYFDIDPLKLDLDAITGILPKAFIKRIGVLPIEVRSDYVTFATSEPFSSQWIMDTSSALKRDIKVVVANPEKIAFHIEEFYDVRSAINNISDEDQQTNQERPLPAPNDQAADEGNVAKLVDWIFQFARNERASDIHLEPRDGYAQMRFRIDGSLRVVYKYKPQIFMPILARMKIMADMKVDEKRRPQDGRIKRKMEGDKIIEMRISTIPTHFGEKMVIRLFDPNMGAKTFADLGFSTQDQRTWEGLIARPYGMILVTGPTGSGKTTMLQTSLSHVAHPDVNICTVEDPIEIINENFSQMQVHHEINLSFGNAIRAFLRQDPDIIMVGEIRDKDTADMAVQASLTGHLVFSTLHTNTALGAITRMIDLGVEHHLLSASLVGILGQRLVKLLCNDCKEKVPTNPELWRGLVAPFNVQMPPEVCIAKGCRNCKNSGYMGRACIYELIVMDESIRSKVSNNVTIDELEAAAKGKYLPMRLNGAQKVLQGKTSIEEVLSVII